VTWGLKYKKNKKNLIFGAHFSAKVPFGYGNLIFKKFFFCEIGKKNNTF
jgi:hypothetical protein